MRINCKSCISSIFLLAALVAAQTKPAAPAKPVITDKGQPAAKAPTVEEAVQFINDAEKKLDKLGIKAQRASWVQENFITDDTEAMAADTQNDVSEAVTKLAKSARRFDGMKLPPDTARKFWLLKLSLTAPAPDNEKE